MQFRIMERRVSLDFVQLERDYSIPEAVKPGSHIGLENSNSFLSFRLSEIETFLLKLDH